MFQGYRTTDVWAAPDVVAPVNVLDAAKISRAVVALPTHNRSAINWYYVHPTSPRRACASMGVTVNELAMVVVDARQMVINSGV